MNALDLYYRSMDSVSVGRPAELRDHYKEYQKCHCYHPQVIQVFNSCTGLSEKMEVPCGKCYHCTETRQNEWVTRMYAHLEDYAYCYFVTLTYRSLFHPDVSSAESIIMHDLKHALWHYDSDNSRHTLAYAPCLLVKQHYQKFIKRLRANTGADITYYLSGEYGEFYSRPHYHIILFSRQPITYKDVHDAWAVKLYRPNKNSPWVHKRNQEDTTTSESHYFPYGRVQVDDLISNGTITHERISVDGMQMAGEHCFSYVCKYLTKKEFYSKRLVKAFDALYGNVRQNGEVVYSRYNSLIDTKVYVEKFDEIAIAANSKVYLPKSYQDEFLQNFPQDYRDFADKFAPFKECSRSTAIGSLFIRKHLNLYSAGVAVKPEHQTTAFVVPSYFRRKVKDAIFSLRRHKFTASGSAYNLGNLKNFADYLQKAVDGDVFEQYSIHCTPAIEDIRTFIHSDFCFRDNETKTYKLVEVKSPSQMVVHSYKYVRSTRSYVELPLTPFTEFVKYYMEKLYQYFLNNERVKQLAENKDYYMGEFQKMVDRTFPKHTVDLVFDPKDYPDGVLHFEDKWQSSAYSYLINHITQTIEYENKVFFDHKRAGRKRNTL